MEQRKTKSETEKKGGASATVEARIVFADMPREFRPLPYYCATSSYASEFPARREVQVKLARYNNRAARNSAGFSGASATLGRVADTRNRAHRVSDSINVNGQLCRSAAANFPAESRRENASFTVPPEGEKKEKPREDLVSLLLFFRLGKQERERRRGRDTQTRADLVCSKK